MMPFDEFRLRAEQIPYSYKHPPFLGALIKWLRPLSVVEVGTHIGYGAVWMARALQENGAGNLTCIDSFCWRDQPTQEEQWYKNIALCDVRPWVTLVKGRSQEVQWPERVDFAYIDGNHTYAVCKHDVEKAVALGAFCVCINDTVSCEGTRTVARHIRAGILLEGWDFLEVNFDAGLLVALKREPKPPPIQGDTDQWDKP